MQTASRFARARWAQLGVLGFLAVAYTWASARDVIHLRCPFACIGIECVGCGFTRALVGLCQFDLEKAYKANRAFVLIIQTMATLGWVYGAGLEKKIPELRYLALLLIAFMIWRNIA